MIDILFSKTFFQNKLMDKSKQEKDKSWVKSMEDKVLTIKTKKKSYFFPLNRYYYTQEPGHIWFKPSEDTFLVGIDDFSQAQGPILHLRMRPKGKKVYPKRKAFGTVETNKFIGPLRLPISASIIEINEDVLNNPQLLNEDPYSNWIVRIKPSSSVDNEISTSPEIIQIGDRKKLEEYIRSELTKYDDIPI
jgi:glycine cleavage system H protein